MTDLDDRATRTRRPEPVRAAVPDGREPPQDLGAEQSVLGGMLLSKDAIADVLAHLRPGDFYRPNHQSIYDAILDLYGKGEPADAVTVAAELDRRGVLQRIGGAPYLHTLVQRWYAEVRAITTPQQRELLLHAHSVKFENSRPAADPVAALANAGRRAARLFPDISGVDGLMRWASEVLGQRCGSDLADAVSAPRSLADDLLMEMAIAPCACVQCGAADAVERPELPLKSMSMVCEQCWPAIAADLALTSQLGQK